MRIVAQKAASYMACCYGRKGGGMHEHAWAERKEEG